MNQLNFEYVTLSEESESLKSNPSYIQESISDILKNQPVIFETEMQQGNFDILLITQFDVNRYDSLGYTIIHHAISYSRTDVVKFLLAKGANPLLKSKLDQSCLMMACSFGVPELVKLFIDLGCSIEETDQNMFTPLGYAVKGKHGLIALYLISLGANTNFEDSQGCSLMHWAAYNGDVYCMKLMQRRDYNFVDDSGNTPLDRALRNTQLVSLNYLIQTHPKWKVKMELALDENVKKLIQIAVRKRMTENHQAWPILRYALTFNFFACHFVDLYLHFGEHFPGSSQTVSNLYIIRAITTIYCCIYSFWFLLKVPSRITEGSEIFSQLGHPKLHWNCNGSCDHNDEESRLSANRSTQLSTSLVDSVKEYFDMEDFQRPYEIDRTCPLCMRVQQDREFHCDRCGTCVPGFQFHSTLLGKCISDINHFLYLLLVLSFLIFSFIYFLREFYAISRWQMLILLPLEAAAAYIMSEQKQTFSFCVYVSTMVVGIYSCIYFVIIMMGILANRTLNEWLYPEQYKYLFEVAKTTSNKYYFVLRGIDNVVKNVQFYVWNSFKSTKLC